MGMNKFEILATVGNKYIIPGGTNCQKIYKRTIQCQSIKRVDNLIRIVFDSNDKTKLQDFFNRIQHLKGTESFFLHFLIDNKWIESRIIEDESDYIFNFMVSDEDKMIDGDILEIHFKKRPLIILLL